MIEHLSLDAINRSAAAFNTEKLNWINQQYLMSAPLESVIELVRQRLDRLALNYDPQMDFATIVDLYRQRVATVNELVDNIRYCFEDFEAYDEKAARRALNGAALEPLRQLRQRLGELESWDAGSIHAVIEGIVADLGVGMGKVGQPLRVAVTGGSFSPPIDQTVEILGKRRTIDRIARAIEFISAENG